MPHGWFNDTMPGRYRPRQTNAARTRISTDQAGAENTVNGELGQVMFVGSRYHCTVHIADLTVRAELAKASHASAADSVVIEAAASVITRLPLDAR